jgi:predicted DNA-binding transcriptional regulator AlpA
MRPRANERPRLLTEAALEERAPSHSSLATLLAPLLSLDDVAATLSVSRRFLERLRAAGKVPKPDFLAGRCPRWKPSTIADWIEGGGA